MNNKHLIPFAVLAFWSGLSWGSPLDASFGKIMPLCEQYFMPNSMALAPGSDPETHIRHIESQLNQYASAFDSPAGIAYLKMRSKSEADDVAKACIRKIEKIIGSDAHDDKVDSVSGETDNCQQAPAVSDQFGGVHEVVSDFRRWRHKREQGQGAVKVHVRVISRTTTELVNLGGSVEMVRYRIHEQGENGDGVWFRVVGEYLPPGRHNAKQTFFDTRYFMPECDEPDINLIRTATFRLSDIPIVAVNELRTGQGCDPDPMTKAVITHFYGVHKRLLEALHLKTESVSSYVETGAKPTHMLNTIYYPNGCTAEDDCTYLTVWIFDSKGAKLDVKNYSWNKDKTRLLLDDNGVHHTP